MTDRTQVEKSAEPRLSSRGEDESHDVEAHRLSSGPAERLSARGEDESPDVEGHRLSC